MKNSTETCFHVAVNGCDTDCGSAEKPFATIERGLEAAKTSATKTVYVHGGNYKTKGIKLDSSNNGTTLTGDGEVSLNCGITVPGADFVTPGEEILARISPAARDNIKCVDLRAYGVTSEMLGCVHAIGAYNTASRYDGDYVGTNCEVFWNDRRMKLARYPNEGFLGLDDVIDIGDTQEFPEQNYHNDWYGRKNHQPGVYKVDGDTACRMKKWQKNDDIWMFGYFYHDWADSSTPLLDFTPEDGRVYPRFVSGYGAKKGAKYYFYNILEELDTDGEYYLDRKNCILYAFLPPDFSGGELLLTVRECDVIKGEGISDFTLSGMTVFGSRGNGISISGDRNTVKNCTVKNVSDYAIVIDGKQNIVTDCEILHTGRGGIHMTGGDRNTLTPGGNLAENNLIHDWSEVYLTYQSGISIYGVGNRAAHNELFNAPHMAIFFSGNDNLIEYNLIHDTVKLSNDAGAIYSGRDWTMQGNVVRYNIVKDLGSEEFNPDGIYLDDAFSGTEVYGNIVCNSGGHPLLIGGGRDNRIYDNLLINDGSGTEFDQRARDGILYDGWYRASVNNRENSVMWTNLDAVPFRSEVWAERYPLLARVKDTFDVEDDDPDFPPNPAHCEFRDNIIYCSEPLHICAYVKDYGAYENNHIHPFADAKEIISALEAGTLDLPKIPVSEIGRK